MDWAKYSGILEIMARVLATTPSMRDEMACCRCEAHLERKIIGDLRNFP